LDGVVAAAVPSSFVGRRREQRVLAPMEMLADHVADR